MDEIHIGKRHYCPVPNCGLVFLRSYRLHWHIEQVQYAIFSAASAKCFQLIKNSGLKTDELDDHNASEGVHISEPAKSTGNHFLQGDTHLRRYLPLRPIPPCVLQLFADAILPSTFRHTAVRRCVASGMQLLDIMVS